MLPSTQKVKEKLKGPRKMLIQILLTAMMTIFTVQWLRDVLTSETPGEFWFNAFALSGGLFMIYGVWFKLTPVAP